MEIRGPNGSNQPSRVAYPVDSNSDLCASCQSLELSPRDFEPSFYAHGRQLFTRVPVQSLRVNTRCPLCQLFVKTLAVAGAQNMGRDVTCSARIGSYNHQTSKNFATLRIWTDTPMHEQPSVSRSKEGHILPVQSARGMEQGFLGRVIEPRGVDNTLLKRWMGKCLVEHGNSCMPDQKSEKLFKEHIQSDLILIDVLDRRITYPVQPGTRYLALSYVWGRRRMPMLLRQNFKAWGAENGLGHCWGEIPTSIQDAIILTQRLGERYLWVDSLCIVQDDPNLKSRLISRMDLIYNHAWLTLVAASGDDAWSGLSGVREWSRNENQLVASVNKDLTLICPVEHETIRDSTWASRGWTLQEWYFSKRRLIFHSGILYFHCCRATFREDLALEEDGNSLFQIPEYDMGNGFRNTIERWEPYSTNQVSVLESRKRYFGIVHAYLRRKLTYEDDILSAIAGIHDHFEEQEDLTLWYGIPRESFGSDMWWRVMEAAPSGKARYNGWPTRLERRLQYPSWSWVGWKIGGGGGPGDHKNETRIQFNVSDNFVHQDKEESRMTSWLVWYRYLPELGFRDMSNLKPTEISTQRWTTKESLKNLNIEKEHKPGDHTNMQPAHVQQPKPSLSLKQIQDIGTEYKSQALKAKGAVMVRTLTARVILTHDSERYNKIPEVKASNLTASLESLPILSRATSWLSPSPSLTRSQTDVISKPLGIAKLDTDELVQMIWRELDLPGTKLEALAGKRVRLALISGPLRTCLEQTSQPKKVLRALLLYELPVDKTKRYTLTERVGVGELSIESYDMLEWEETNVVIH
jgi:hypothetical protein